MSKALPTYTIKVNGKYFAGYSDTSDGKTSHMGWQPQAVEMDGLVFNENRENAKIVEGNVNLKSYLDAIYERMRFCGLIVDSIEVHRVGASK
jgi:hypothetical protein